MSILLVGTGGDYATIEAALAAASNGDTIQVAAGSYTLSSTLSITKEVTITGAGEGLTVITAAASGYGIEVTANNVTLDGFTLYGPTANAGSSYGIKVQPDSGDPADRLEDFTLSNVTVIGSGRSEIDLNGVDGATLTNVTANGNGTAGVGIALTDSANITLTDITTTGNAWGSVALYNANRFYDQATGSITFSGTYSAAETIKIFAQDNSNGISGDGNTEVNGTSTNLGPVTLPADHAGNHGFQVQFTPGAATSATYWFATEAEADAFLALLPAPQKAAALLQDPNGDWLVKSGMSVQNAVNAAASGDTISIYPGTYIESGYPVGQSGNPGGLYINTPNLTLRGVDANGDPILDAATAETSGPTIIAGHQNNFGANHWLDKDADNVTLTGIHWKAGLETNNKVLEVWGDNVTIAHNFIDRINQADEDTFAVAIYLNGDGTAVEDWITAYLITNNRMNEGIVVANGVGDPGLGISPNQIITFNTFLDGYDYDTGLGRYDAIVLNGQVPTIGWLLEPTQIPTIGANDFGDGTTPFVLRGTDGDTDNLPNLSEVEAILGDNVVARYAYVIDPATGDLRYATTTTGSGDIHRFAVTNTIDTLNLGLDTTGDAVFGGQRIYMEEGDTVVIQSGASTLDSEVMVEDLTIRAEEGSADLNLTMATTLADGTPIAGGGVVEVTLADYAPGEGADVDVTGNALANIITGNSGANALSGEAGNDRLAGGAGVDVIDGGADTDTAVYSDTVTVADVGGEWVVTSAADGTEVLADIEIVEDAVAGNTLLVGNGGFATIQAAINAAQAGDTILVAAGTYDEDLVINKAVTILGAQAGVAGSGVGRDASGGAGETTIIGRSEITTPGGVTLDGLRFLNDGTTTGGGAGAPTLQLTGSSAGGAHVITNSVFWSTVLGGANGVDDRAISSEVMGSGSITVTDNLISGTSTGGFSTAAWGRGLWFDGGGVNLTASGNSFQSTRTGMNIDVEGTSDISITGNSFTNAGTGISGGLNTGGVLDGITDNDFTNVGTEFNFRNLTTDLVFDAEIAVDTLTPVGPDSAVLVLGGTGSDSLAGTAGSDVLNGNGLNAAADADTLDGWAGADLLQGNGGDDRLTGGAGNDSIDGGTGSDTMVLTGNRADYTFSGTYPGIVTVTDTRGGSPDGTDTVVSVETVVFADRTMTLEALANNAAPDDIAFTGSVAEDAASGAVVGTATATDPNTSGGDTVTFSLTDDAGGLFAINAATGEVTLVGTLDAETALTHSITIRATDSGGLTYDEIVSVAVGDLDEFNVSAPVDDDNATDAVLENAALGTAVGIDVSATDADATTNTVTYSLDNSAGGRFSIDANGVVKVAGVIDREAAASYDIVVRATSSDGSFSTETFTIAVGDADEFDVSAVADEDAASDAVLENAAIGTAVGIDASATDGDATATVTYALDDDAGGLFSIDANGVVKVAGVIDRETAASYDIVVRATSSDGSFSTQSFTIAVGDADEFDVSTPVDANNSVNTVAENAASGTTVGVTAFASDDDATTNAVTYSLLAPTGEFAINATTGVVTVAGSIDREAGASRTITVEALSADGSSATQTFTIAVSDVDEIDVSTPVDANGALNTVAENAANGTVVGVTASAFDGDATTNTVTYSLTDDAGGQFAIDATTGVVTVLGSIDFEAGASRSITVQAASTDGSTASQTFTIAVTNVNEVPVITTAATASVVEGTTFVLDNDATDPDLTSPVWSIVGGADAALFTINATTGVLSFIAPPDFEAPTDAGGNNVYDVTVRASDGTLFDDQAIAVTVTDGGETVSVVLTAASDTYSNAASVDNLVVDGLGGNDTITTGFGSDVVFGNTGDDVIATGSGNDVVTFLGSTGGFDSVDGGAGSDDRINALGINAVIGLSALSGIETVSANGFTGVTIRSSTANNTLDFSAVTLSGITSIDMGDGDDTITGSEVADTILGGRGNDRMSGGNGNDVFLIGGTSGTDSIAGGAGNDRILATASNLTLTVSAISGIDEVSAGSFANFRILGTTAANTLDFSATVLTGIALIDGGSGADTITGNTAANTLAGGAGNDQIFAGDGDDVILVAGSGGNDTVDGGDGFDTLRASANNVAIGWGSFTGVEAISSGGFSGTRITGTSAGETIDLSAYMLTGIATIDGGGGSDTILGSAGADTITGGSGSTIDTLQGGAGNDVLIFGAGADIFNGGADTDTLRAGAANAGLLWSSTSIVSIEAISSGGFSGVRISGTGGAEAIDLSTITLTGISLIDAGTGDDTVLGSAAADTIQGGGGNDTLSGGGANDLFLFGISAGQDSINGGSGTDTIRASQSNVSLTWGSYTDVEAIEGGGFTGVRILGTTGNDTIDLSAYTITGIAAVEGSGGNDTILGSSGADTLVGGAGADTLTGNAGADVFDFNLATESRGSTIDVLTDFLSGTDLIDLGSIDANTGAAADQAFSFIGAGAFTNVAGQLRYDSTTLSGVTRILGDTDGNGSVDLEIHLTGTYALTGANFSL